LIRFLVKHNSVPIYGYLSERQEKFSVHFININIIYRSQILFY